MSWRTITETDLKTAISADELDVLRRALGAEGSDTIAASIIFLADEARAAVATGGTDLDATAHTVPEALIRRIVQIAVVYLSTRAGGILPDPKGLRKEAAQAAEKYMQDVVAAGKIAIETPTSPSTSAQSNVPGGPSMTAKTLTIQKTDQAGL